MSTQTRKQMLSNEVYTHTFELLDSEFDMTSDEAGRIATEVQSTFDREYKD